MDKKNNNKKTARIVLILIIILFISAIILIVALMNDRTPKENLEYINSEEIDEGTFSPEFIHIIVASYEGDVNPKAISKSTYYFTTNLVPKYLKYCDNEENTKKYYNQNTEDIKIDIGIESEEEFIELISEIQKLTPNLEYEYSRFGKDEIVSNNRNLQAKLYIKYKNNPEICVTTTISNSEYTNKTSIKFSK